MAMYSRYKDPKLAMIAYNMGPGATDRWLADGGDPRRLPKETQGYIRGVNLAKGGEVKHFYTGDYLPYGEEVPYDPKAPSIYDTFGNILGSPLERLKNSIYGVGAKSNKELAQDQKTKSAPAKKPSSQSEAPPKDTSTTDQDLRNFDQAAALFQAENMNKNEPIQAQEAPQSRLDAFMEKMLERENAIEKQRGMDKNMALLAAGLGMLGGTSQYAWENIGKGGLAGVQQYGESNKQRAAEQAAIDKSMLYANRYKGAEDLARQNALYNRGIKQQQYDLDVQKLGTEQQKIAINQYESHINNAIKSLDKNPLLTADPVARAVAEDKIINSPEARALRRRAYGNMQVESPTFAGFSATERKK